MPHLSRHSTGADFRWQSKTGFSNFRFVAHFFRFPFCISQQLVSSFSFSILLLKIFLPDVEIKEAMSQRENDETNHVQFWQSVDRHVLSPAVGLPSTGIDLSDIAPFVLSPVRGDKTFNSEHSKGPHHFRPTTNGQITMSAQQQSAVEEFIREGHVDNINMLNRSELLDWCLKMGIERTSVLNKSQLRDEIHARIQSDYGACSKLFCKPPNTSGGVIFAVCQHEIVYGFKVHLRAESVAVSKYDFHSSISQFSKLNQSMFVLRWLQDVSDLLRSMKLWCPRVVVYDYACGLSKYLSSRYPDLIDQESLGAIVPPVAGCTDSHFEKVVSIPELQKQPSSFAIDKKM